MKIFLFLMCCFVELLVFFCTLMVCDCCFIFLLYVVIELMDMCPFGLFEYRFCHLQQLEHLLLRVSIIGRTIQGETSKLSKKKTKTSQTSPFKPSQDLLLLLQQRFNLQMAQFKMYVTNFNVSRLIYDAKSMYFSYWFTFYTTSYLKVQPVL